MIHGGKGYSGGMAPPGIEDVFIAEQIELFQDYEIIDRLDLLENWEAIASLDEKT